MAWTVHKSKPSSQIAELAYWNVGLVNHGQAACGNGAYWVQHSISWKAGTCSVDYGKLRAVWAAQASVSCGVSIIPAGTDSIAFEKRNKKKIIAVAPIASGQRGARLAINDGCRTGMAGWIWAGVIDKVVEWASLNAKDIWSMRSRAGIAYT